MEKSEERGSPSWGASLFMQTTEDFARAVIYSSKDDNGSSQLQKLQRQFTKVMQGFSSPSPEKSGTYNPEVLTSQKRQWASFQSQYLDHRALKEPERLFESMVVVGLHPNCDIKALQRQYVERKLEGFGKLRTPLGRHNHSHVEPNLEPQVLFVYPPERELPLKQKALLSFCFPVGMEVRAIERTPSMSELNEILLGQERLKQSDLSFVFRLQVGDDSTLYGCCVLVEELVQKSSGLLSVISDKEPSHSSLRRHILATRRCYCILSRLPFFELHFSVLNSIFMEERLERLTRGITVLNLDSLESKSYEENLAEDANGMTWEKRHINESDKMEVVFPRVIDDKTCVEEHQLLEGDLQFRKKGFSDNLDVSMDDPETQMIMARQKHSSVNVFLPHLRRYQYESSESSSSFQWSPSEDRNFRSDVDDTETEEASFSGQEDSNDLTDIIEWAKENNHGTLQILCDYYRLGIPLRGSTLKFHPLEHLLPIEYRRSDETVLQVDGLSIILSSSSTNSRLAEAKHVLSSEEEATALSIWTVACLSGSLRLEHILTIFAGALLEKQIVIICSNLGILSASVLSLIPLIRPYQWQSFLTPVLPNDMLDFLDAPVPYIMGVKNKPCEAQSKLSNVILVDASKNQVKAPTIPQLPKHKELLSSLSPYHAKLVGESYLGRKRPVYECTDAQVEAANGFLAVLRQYLDSLCSNLRSHTITNVQSNDDKVSLLLKESFIDSFPSRDRPFMKQFVDTQLFSVHTDLVLSVFQKE